MPKFRFFIGLLIALAALWIIVGEQLSGASADATINARVATVRAPIAGTLDVPTRALGSRVTPGELLASVEDPQVDGVRLDDLELELAYEAALVTRLSAVIAETAAMLETLDARHVRYRDERIAEIETRLSHARDRLAALETGATPEGRDAEVALALSTDTERAPLEPQLPELWISYARERVATLEIALRAAQDGVFLGNGYNDAPVSEQRRIDLLTEHAAQTAARAEAEARLAALTGRRDTERLRVNRAGAADIPAPVGGIYWEELAADDVAVQRGDPLSRVVDCRSIMVTASVSEAIYNRLSVGEKVTFRPRGENRTFAASVDRLAGAGAATIYGNLAIAPSQKHLERYDVMIAVPGLSGDPDLGCAVGRTGRVFFETRPLDWLRAWRD